MRIRVWLCISDAVLNEMRLNLMDLDGFGFGFGFEFGFAFAPRVFALQLTLN